MGFWWYLLHCRAAKAQMNLRNSADSPEPSLPACTKYGTRRRFKLGLEVIKLEFILRLKIKRNGLLLADTCESEALIKFYNLEAKTRWTRQHMGV